MCKVQGYETRLGPCFVPDLVAIDQPIRAHRVMIVLPGARDSIGITQQRVRTGVPAAMPHRGMLVLTATGPALAP